MKSKISKVKIGDVHYTTKGKKLIVDVTVPPKEWPNGSAFYSRAPKGPRWSPDYDENKNLIGHTIGEFGKPYRAWRHIGAGKFRYIGEFPDSQAALKALR